MLGAPLNTPSSGKGGGDLVVKRSCPMSVFFSLCSDDKMVTPLRWAGHHLSYLSSSDYVLSGGNKRND